MNEILEHLRKCNLKNLKRNNTSKILPPNSPKSSLTRMEKKKKLLFDFDMLYKEFNFKVKIAYELM